jgi:hypothetical protein
MWRDSIELRAIPLWLKSKSVRLNQTTPSTEESFVGPIGFDPVPDQSI